MTSKHSLGSGQGDRPTHAQKGEEWLEKHLHTVGKTKKELANELWTRNETAVAELCDDSFEEHVLAYPPERTGLHLHGLNRNTPQFHTRKMVEVEAFANQWGFLPTRFIIMESLRDVDAFCRKIAETGSWQGIPIEGFVVRTHMPNSISKDVDGLVAPPYAPNQEWFYKVKFDEPYLMYRDWRELTRRMLSDKAKYDKERGSLDPTKISDDVLHDPNPHGVEKEESGLKSKKEIKREARKAQQERLRHEKRAAAFATGLPPPDPPQTRSKRAETKLFVQWCHEKIYGSEDGKVSAEPNLFADFGNNQGIIRLRERYLDFLRSNEGQKKLGKTETSVTEGQNVHSRDLDHDSRPFDKTLLVPVAVPGCGKTQLAVALQRLFPDMGHTQSDDVQARKTAPIFLQNILQELSQHSVVFADRNNHLFKHRNEIVNSVHDWESGKCGMKKHLHPPKDGNNREDKASTNNTHHVRLVALAWSLDALPLNAIHHICSDRITVRGENHQSLRLTQNREHEQILWQFLRNLEPFGTAELGSGDQGHGDEKFHNVIRMDVNASLEQNILKALSQLSPIFGLPIPSNEQISEAVAFAKNYKVEMKKEAKAAKGPSVRYFALAAEVDLLRTLPKHLQGNEDAFLAFEKLSRLKRVNPIPHVTLVHSNELLEQDMVDSKEVQASAQKRWDRYASLNQGTAPVIFKISVDRLAWDDRVMALGIREVTSDSVEDIRNLQGQEWRPHITIGTADGSIKPYEGNRVLYQADLGIQGVCKFELPHHLLITSRLKAYSN